MHGGLRRRFHGQMLQEVECKEKQRSISTHIVALGGHDDCRDVDRDDDGAGPIDAQVVLDEVAAQNRRQGVLQSVHGRRAKRREQDECQHLKKKKNGIVARLIPGYNV